MRQFRVEESLQKTLSKLKKKDPILWQAVAKKMQEILQCQDVNHYKNLRSPLQDFKRIHITGSHILLFLYHANDDLVIFYDFDHWDGVYK